MITFLPGLRVYATELELPVIEKWEGGRGYDNGGVVIKDSWAVDESVSEGRYVYFNQEGHAIGRADEILDDLDFSSYYADTNLTNGAIALRLQDAESFDGTIFINFTNSAGVTKEYELTQKTGGYDVRIELIPDAYTVEAHAADGDGTLYSMELSRIELSVQEDDFILLKMSIPEFVANPEEVSDTGQEQEESENPETEEESMEGSVDDSMVKENNKNHIWLIAVIAICAIAVVATVIVKKKKEGESGGR